MAMCPRENDVSAISRKFAGITRVFLSPPSPATSASCAPLPPPNPLRHFPLPLLRSCFFLFLYILFFTLRMCAHASESKREKERERESAERYERAISRALFASSRVNGRPRASKRGRISPVAARAFVLILVARGCIGYQYFKGDRGALCTRACIFVNAF